MGSALPAQDVRSALFATVPGEITPSGQAACTVRVSAESVEPVSQYVAAIAALGAECTLRAPPALALRIGELGRRLSAAAG